MRPYRESMRLVAQPLDEVKRWIVRRQPKRLAAFDKEGRAAGVAVGALGDSHDGPNCDLWFGAADAR